MSGQINSTVRIDKNASFVSQQTPSKQQEALQRHQQRDRSSSSYEVRVWTADEGETTLKAGFHMIADDSRSQKVL